MPASRVRGGLFLSESSKSLSRKTGAGKVCGGSYRKPGLHQSWSQSWSGTVSTPPTRLLGAHTLLRSWRDSRSDKRKPGQPVSSLVEGRSFSSSQGEGLLVFHFPQGKLGTQVLS